MKLVRYIFALIFVLFSFATFAQDGTLTIRAMVVGSVNLEVQTGGQTTSGPGTVTLTTTLGALSEMQSAPAGFTLARDVAKVTLTAIVQSRALKTNLPNTSYALMARLERPLPSGVTWMLNGVALSSDTPSRVTSATFGQTDTLDLQIDVNNSASAAPLDNAIIFTAVPN